MEIMKLQLNDSTKAVITAITTEVKRAASFDDNKAEYFYYILVNGLELRYYGNNKQAVSQRDFNKLLLKGAREQYQPLPLTEEEQGWADGVAADCSNPKMHGHVVYSILDNVGGSGIYVWDYYQQKTVLKSELTNI